MNILLTVDPDIPVPPKLYGGIERIVDGLVRELRDRGHKVGLVAHQNSTCSVDYLKAWPNANGHGPNHVRNAMTLMKAVRAFQPDLVHSFSRLGYLLPILPRRIPKLMSYQRHTGGNQISVAAKLGGESLTFVGCSDYIASMGRAWGSSWTTIPNFVDTDFYSFAAEVEDDAPLVSLSRIERIKGAHTAIAVARQTGRRLVLAGNPVASEEGRRYWTSEIEPFIGKDRVEYVGPVDDAQKRELLRSAAALIVPIEWEEPFGIVFIEGMACGTPVISSPRGALPEIISDGKEGFLAANLEECVNAVRRLKEIKRIDCRSRVEESFSRKVVVSQYEQVYARLMNGRH